MYSKLILIVIVAVLAQSSSAKEVSRKKRDVRPTPPHPHPNPNPGFMQVFLRPFPTFHSSGVSNGVPSAYEQLPEVTTPPNSYTTTHPTPSNGYGSNLGPAIPAYVSPPRPQQPVNPYGTTTPNPYHTTTTQRPSYAPPQQQAISLQPVVDGYGKTIGYLIPASVVRPDGPSVFAIIPERPQNGYQPPTTTPGYGTTTTPGYGTTTTTTTEPQYALVPAFYEVVRPSPPPQPAAYAAPRH